MVLYISRYRILLFNYPRCFHPNFTRVISSVASQAVLEQNPVESDYLIQPQNTSITLTEQKPKHISCFSWQSVSDTDIVSTYASVAQGCTSTRTLNQLNAHIIVCGIAQNVFLGTKLVHMYSKHGSLENARQVFDKMQRRNAFIWNAILRGYAWNGPYEETLALYNRMQCEGIWPDNFAYAFALKACSVLSALHEGKKIHGQIVVSGFESHVFVTTALLDMYAKCSSVDDARQLFDKMLQRDVVAWNAMIAAYAQNERANDAVMLFCRMRWEYLLAVLPDSGTMVNVLPAFAEVGDLRQGKCMHGYVLRNGFDLDPFVGNSLIDMYSKCGSLVIARQMFDKMSTRDVVSWNAMIVGYAQNGHASEALTLFHQMLEESITPNPVAIASVISACAHLGALEQGKWIHDYINKNTLEVDVFVTNSLIGMFSKCGSLELARKIFNKMPVRDVVSWNTMIAGYGVHGCGKETLELFSEMQRIGMRPNHITFIHILSACSHGGLVDEGCQCFDCMIRKYQIKPNMEHYACMVDLLGRAGRLDEAQRFIENMPVEPVAGVWGTLLGACRIHKHVELGERVAERVFSLDPTYPGYYVLLSNMYAEVGRWGDVLRVRRLMKERNLKKTPGWSTVELHGKVDTFYAGDKSHPQSNEIYAMLDSLAQEMEKAGYVPNTNFVLHDVEEEEKEDMLSSHSEKLAIAFVLINTSPGTPIRLTKNLRVCGDCHTATKFISKIVRREIVVRDAHRFHHFKDGFCSCRDYW
ncbi:pentatricopeptide repeat-containing protein At3g12770 [Cryptomeria japonica]|uniref:pentatricopeptide repeat-containing protein At3g12770 n=1 Tax=Cryptomeria japonica TaxID=3369 RepID=UPI0027DA2D3D|nr:pentatricopeptide repeat-containing protein At3g12770 [Cryptomeria japonica]